MTQSVANGARSDVDITGGYDPELDFFLPSLPDNPAMRDSASFWLNDDKGRIGLPRFTIEAVASQWGDRGIQANIAFPDGRVLIGAGGFAPSPAKVVNGRTVTLNAGPLTFEIIEPLRRWKMTYDGHPYETTVAQQIEGVTTGPTPRVRIEVDGTMVAPPWTAGEKADPDDRATALSIGAVGGHRHEQLFLCKGVVEIEGEAPIEFEGRGLKVRRYGERDVSGFSGHCWQSAVFPSGNAFGSMAFPPREDGTPFHSEAFILENGRKLYAKVVEAPWMTEIVPHGGPCGVTLQTEDGRLHRIEGSTYDTTFIARGNPLFGDWALNGKVDKRILPWHQGGILYTWNGESAYGMTERSLPHDKMTGLGSRAVPG